jgi:type IV pilus assembly protein PilQ
MNDANEENINMGIINTLFGQDAATSANVTPAMPRCRLCLLLAGVLLLLVSTGAIGATLDFIDFKKLSDDRVEIRLAFSDDAPQPTDTTVKNPPGISLDLPGIKNNLPWSLPLPVDTGVVKNVKAVQTRGSTLVTVNVEELKDYELRTEGKNIFVTVENEPPQEKLQAVTPLQTAVPKTEPTTPVTQSSGSTGTVASLQKATFTSLPGDSVQVRLSFSGPISNPGNFTINNPARVVLDFPKTSNALGWKNKNIGIGFVKSMTAVEAGNRTRVILNLVQLIPFETEISGNSVIITMAGSRTARSDASASSIQAANTVATTTDTTAKHRINNIDFRRGEKGEGRIIVELSDQDTPVSTGETGNQIFVEFGSTSLPSALQQRLDVMDFATPVQYIDATQSGNRVRLTITPTGDYEYLAYHTGNSYTIEVSEIPKEAQEKAKKDEFGYTGDRLSLNFQDIEVRAVLQLIADFTGLNMVTSDSVSGSLTLRLKNVPWDQALDIILKTKGLAMRKAGNVILVAPAQEIAAQEKLELEASKQIEELAPLRTDLIQVNYSKAEDLAKILESKGGLLSERGEINVDERTNILLVTDTGDRLDEIRELVSRLDIPVRQVMIDSRIVIADDKFAKDLGVRFGVTSVNERSNDDLIFNSGRLDATDTMAGSALDNLADGAPNAPYPIALPMGSGGIPQRMNVNMPVIAPNAGAFALSILTSDTLLDLELSALQTEGRGEVLSNPRVITSNQHEALIEQGTEIPYQRAASSGATAVTFKKAVLSLRVTPQITPDDRIILDLKVNKDSVGQIFAGVPSIDTKAVETEVLMNNGETVVLGGVYEQVTRTDSARVPFFGDLPFIGALFRSTSERNEKTELLIFVTPKIVKQEFLEK